MNSDTSGRIGAEALLELRGANREAKAYAFLYAAFKRTEISSNPVRDALDCLVPFISPYLNEVAGTQVTADKLQSYLHETYGFSIPLYAIEQIFNSLQKQGYTEYVKSTKIHLAKAHQSNFHVARKEIETDYDLIVSDLEIYAKKLGFDIVPPSGGWGGALVSFLRQNREKSASKPISVKNVLMDPRKAEEAVVASYVQKLHATESTKFESLIAIFMGALVEEFISSVSELGAVSSSKPINVYYDTAVLLRQLGCSGTSLRVATEELTRYLQDIGCNIYYFSGNEQEVSNIIDTIVFVKDSGKEVEGETAEALSLGQVTISDLRLLQNAFPEKLATDNIFPAGSLEQIPKELERFQIDEKGLGDFLFRQAVQQGRAYGVQNRANDAGYVAAIMRLRRGNRPRDFADCGHVFVTQNRLLSFASRKYLSEQKALYARDCPPVLRLGQIATIAWLMKDQALSPEKAGRELLLNCYAFIHPDAEWFKFFREGMEKVVGSMEEFVREGSNVMALQAARRIAAEESFGHSLVVRELNMAEILARAKEEEAKLKSDWESHRQEQNLAAQAEIERVQSEARAIQEEMLRQSEELRRSAIQNASAETEARIKAEVAAERKSKAETRADAILILIKVLLLVALASALVAGTMYQDGVWLGVSIFMGFATLLSFADLLRIPVMDQYLLLVRTRLKCVLEKL